MIKIYDGLSRCNTALAQLENSTLESSLRTRLMGEVYFIRGYWYFYASRIFGGVPVFTENVTPSDFVKLSASLHQTYLQVEVDFKANIENLPERSEYSGAEMAEQPKGQPDIICQIVYVYDWNDAENTEIGWQQVYDQTEAIIQSDEYSLVSNYATIFEPEGRIIPNLFLNCKCWRVGC